MKLLRLVLAYLSARGGRKGGPANLLLQMLLTRGLRRSPAGFIATLLVQKILTGDGRLWGMDLASRRKARMALLGRLIGWHGLQSPLDNRRRSAAKR